MTDEELIARLRGRGFGLMEEAADLIEEYGRAYTHLLREFDKRGDRIEALVVERDQWVEHTKNAVWSDSEELTLANTRAEAAEVRVERLEAALREIAAEAYVAVETKKHGGIKYKWMYFGWREIAIQRIDIARAALKSNPVDDSQTADPARIEALVKYRDAYAEMERIATEALRKAEARAERLAATNERLEAALQKAIAAIEEVQTYKQPDDPWTENALTMEELDIFDFDLTAARTALEGAKP